MTGDFASKARGAFTRVFAAAKKGRRFLLFGLLTTGILLLFLDSLVELFRFSLDNVHYSHMVLIPPVSIGLIFLDRRRIFSSADGAGVTGFGLLFLVLSFYFLGLGRLDGLSQNDRLSLVAMSFVSLWVGGFVVCFGARAARRAAFPLAFLFFMVPAPEWVLDRTVSALQEASVWTSVELFNLLGVPVLRDGFHLNLPEITVEVARACSGIRSSIALLITTVLAGHLVLRRSGSRLLLLLCVFPLTVIKNAVRIVTITLLTMHVDEAFMTSRLHTSGGILFFLLALALLAPVLCVLRRHERRRRTG